tara:strand:- start:2361 stop:3119 length:759 start_codon:yes stop_codon:yes gene_type:complete
MNNQPKILFYDIETSQLTSKHWALYNQNIQTRSIQNEWHIICISYKWLHEKKVHTLSLDFDKSTTDDYDICKGIKKVFKEADLIVGHNGDKFDWKKIMARWLKHKISPLPPILSVDTLKVARKEFKLTSNKLDYIAQYIEEGAKLETGGLFLWEECAKGNKKALQKMVKYCEVDVKILEKIYLRIRPFMSNHPNLSTDAIRVNCPSCGSYRKDKRNRRRTKSGILKQQYKCKDCKCYYTLRASERTKSLTQS